MIQGQEFQAIESSKDQSRKNSSRMSGLLGNLQTAFKGSRKDNSGSKGGEENGSQDKQPSVGKRIASFSTLVKSAAGMSTEESKHGSSLREKQEFAPGFGKPPTASEIETREQAFSQYQPQGRPA